MNESIEIICDARISKDNTVCTKLAHESSFFFHFLLHIQQLAITWSLVKQISSIALPKIKLYPQALFESSENFKRLFYCDQKNAAGTEYV